MIQPLPLTAATRATGWAWRGAKLMFTFCLLALASQVSELEALTPSAPVSPASPSAAPAPSAPAEPVGRGGRRLPLPAQIAAVASASPVGTVRRLAVGRQMLHGDYVWNEEGVPPGRLRILVDLSAQTLSVIRGGHEIGRAVILYGTDENPTPLGTFPIIEKDADHVSNRYEAIMPYMLRLTRDGIAVHGSNVRYGWGSRGCVGVPDEFAALLFAQARVGDVVTIVRGAATAAAP